MLRFVHRLCLMVFCVLPLSVQAGSISGVTIRPGPGGAEEVVFTTDAPITVQKQFTLDNPDRVVIDIPRVKATGIAMPMGYRGQVIKNIRFGQFDGRTSRLVIDVAAPSRILSTAAEGMNKLVIEIQPLGPVAEAPATRSSIITAPASSPFAVMDPEPVPPAQVPVVKKKPLIIIDAGHGGEDPGAIGNVRQTREKEVTLAMAKAVKAGLLKTGRYDVKLTRESDIFIPLQGRVDIARKVKGDVFISLHADSNPRPDAKGLSIYTLSETASDDEAAALADRENKADIIAGLDLNTADEDVASILIDLTQRETMNKSAILADMIVKNLSPKVTKLGSTHRFAGFRVLKAPDIPSVLIELGFLSNRQDEQLLMTAAYQEAVVASLIKGLDSYMQE